MNLLTRFYESLSRQEKVGVAVGVLLGLLSYVFLAGGAVNGGLNYDVVYPVTETVCATNACEYGISPCWCLCEGEAASRLFN